MALDVLAFRGDCVSHDGHIYYGIPPMPPRKRSGAPPSFVGFLYLSLGLALIFASLQQGERLDWWRSGVFNGLF